MVDLHTKQLTEEERKKGKALDGILDFFLSDDFGTRYPDLPKCAFGYKVTGMYFQIYLGRNPFNAKDTSQVEFTDVVEGSEYYDAVRFAYENGLMSPKADDAFGTDDPSTAGDFFGAMNVLIGGSNAADEAVATFAQYGLVPDGMEVGTELTVGSGADLFSTVTAALGAAWTPEVEAGAEGQPLTRGQMAQWLSDFLVTLQ